MVSRNTTLVPSLGFRIGLACEAGLSAGMRRERVPPQKRNKEKKSYFAHKVEFGTFDPVTLSCDLQNEWKCMGHQVSK